MGYEPPTPTARAEEQQRRRLTPAMASFRLLVLDFVRNYLERNGASPSYGEIGAGLDCSRTQVKRAVKSLVRDQLLLQGDTPRSLALPTERDRALRALRGLGFRVDEAARTIAAPVADPPLLPPAALRYPDLDDEECEINGSGEKGGGETGSRSGEASP